MIRFALALLGLSAGAADAQRLVPSASALENCGLHVEMQAEDIDTTMACQASITDQVGDEDGSAPIVPQIAVDDVILPTSALVQRATVPVEPTGAKTPSEFIQTIFRATPECLAAADVANMQPVTADTIYSVAMDGSNPSAMFCP